MSRHEPSQLTDSKRPPSEEGVNDDGREGIPKLVADGGDDAVFDDLDDGGDLDGFDDFDDGLDDDFDDGGGSGGPPDGTDLEPRVKELEAQLDSISNSVETVKIDTDELSDSIGHIQDNIRQLLDIYEIVARSANPFADDPDGGFNIGEAAFDLFGDLEEEFPENEEEPEPDGAETPDADGEADDEAAGDGQTFDDLKAQYDEEEEENGGIDGEDEEMDEEEGTEEERVDEESAEMDDPGEKGDPIDLGDDAADTLSFSDDDWSIEPDDDVLEDGEESTGVTEADGEPSTGTIGGRADPGKPYLGSLPDGYAADVIVMEWVAFLVSAGNERGALGAIQYYRDLNWISGDVATALGDRVRRSDLGSPGASTGSLSTDHHTRSLSYITHLGGSGGTVPGGIELGGVR